LETARDPRSEGGGEAAACANGKIIILGATRHRQTKHTGIQRKKRGRGSATYGLEDSGIVWFLAKPEGRRGTSEARYGKKMSSKRNDTKKKGPRRDESHDKVQGREGNTVPTLEFGDAIKSKENESRGR